MAHTYEQTLLSRFGFADPDRQNSLHDEACRYLSGPTGSEAVVNALLPQGTDSFSSTTGLRRVTKYRNLFYRGEQERTLSKGKSHSRFTVGFLDVVIHSAYQREEKVTVEQSGLVRLHEKKDINCPYLVEVKVEPVNIGQILRQINLYRDFVEQYVYSDLADLRGYEFVLATCYKPTVEELDTLSDAFIYHLYLGKGFKQFRELAHRNSSAPTLNEV